MAGFDYNQVIDTVIKTVETSNNLCYPLSQDETINSLIFSSPVKCSRLEAAKVLSELIASNIVFSYSGFLFNPSKFTPEMAEHLMETRTRYDANHLRAKVMLSNNFKFLKKLHNVKFIGFVDSPFPESILSLDVVLFTSSDSVWVIKSLAEKFFLKNQDFDRKIFLILEERAFDLRNFNLLDLKKLAFIKPLYDDQTYTEVLSDFYNKNLWIFDHIPFYPLNNLDFKFVSKTKNIKILHKPNIVNKSVKVLNKSLFKNYKLRNPDTFHTENFYYIWNKGVV